MYLRSFGEACLVSFSCLPTYRRGQAVDVSLTVPADHQPYRIACDLLDLDLRESFHGCTALSAFARAARAISTACA